jgi:hypothetical protein
LNICLKIRIENGGNDAAAGTKYALGWQGMEKRVKTPQTGAIL